MNELDKWQLDDLFHKVIAGRANVEEINVLIVWLKKQRKKVEVVMVDPNQMQMKL